jgi:hypothetical protein
MTTAAPKWLTALEQRVHEAAARLTALAEDNARLAARVAALEAELAAARAASAAPGEEGEAAWRRDRDEIRARVEGLVARLGELLDEG